MIFYKTDGSGFKRHTLWLIGLTIGVILICGYHVWISKDENRFIKWSDDTVGWIVSQEVILAPAEVKIGDISKITRLDLDAETIKNMKDLKDFSDLEELTINVKNIRNINNLRRLKKLERLTVINGNMKTLKCLKDLNISTLVLKNFTLSDIDLLVEMDNLNRLEITDTHIADPGSFKELSNLSFLSLANVTAEEPISLCESGNYKEVSLSNIEISDISIVSSLEHITSLKLENLPGIDYREIELPSGLKKVTIKDCGLRNLDMFLTLPGLTSLDVSSNEIRDISDLEKIHNLDELSLANNPISDISPIGCLEGNISLNLSGIDLDRTGLEVLTNMQFDELSVSNCNISDLKFLTGHNEIKRLDISHNAIEDIEILKMYGEELKYLNISWNPIMDLSALKEWMPYMMYYDKEFHLIEGAELDVSGIQLEKISFEKGIEVIQNLILSKLTARNCGLKSAELAMFQGKLEFLDISNNPIDSFWVLEGLPPLADIIAKDTLILEDDLPPLSIQLTPPGTYGIASLWKMPRLSFRTDFSQRTWIRIVIK